MAEQSTQDDVILEVCLRALSDPHYRRRLLEDPDAILGAEGAPDPASASELKMRLIPLIRAAASRAEQTAVHVRLQESTAETADQFKIGLQKALDQIDRGFQATMVMYQVAFYLGVGLVVAATALAFLRSETLLPVVFGGLGAADIIAYFIAKPPQDLQRSRAKLAQLQAAFFNWFVDSANWNGLLIGLEERGRLDPQAMKEVSSALMRSTERTLRLMQEFGQDGLSQAPEGGQRGS